VPAQTEPLLPLLLDFLANSVLLVPIASTFFSGKRNRMKTEYTIIPKNSINLPA
jgi:hypothetical protein